MEMTMPKYGVFIKTDENNFITQIEGECSLSNLGDLNTPDIHLIDEGEGERYYHAQGRYLDKPIFDMESGCYNYKYVDGEIVEVSDEEKQPFYEKMEKAREEAERNSPQYKIADLEAKLFYVQMMTDTLEE